MYTFFALLQLVIMYYMSNEPARRGSGGGGSGGRGSGGGGRTNGCVRREGSGEGEGGQRLTGASSWALGMAADSFLLMSFVISVRSFMNVCNCTEESQNNIVCVLSS